MLGWQHHQHFCVPLHAVRGGAGTVANGCTDYCGIMIFHGLTIPAQHGRQCLIKQASSVTEVRVILRDGSGMMSRLPRNFEEWPNGPFTTGIKAIWFFTSRTAALQAVTMGKV